MIDDSRDPDFLENVLITEVAMVVSIREVNIELVTERAEV